MKQEEKCSKCMGHGWWPIGDLVPIGEMDAKEWGDKVIQCPWCGKPENGVTGGKRYQVLKLAKDTRK
jgi:Zn finger protein HypA/HybF involved in hydrogenase expression